jgi:hypothetical protein
VLCFVSTKRVHALSEIAEDRPAPMLINRRSIDRLARKRDRPFAPFALLKAIAVVDFAAHLKMSGL